MTFSTILKWIGYGTAILTFAAGVREIASVISSRVETRHKTEALLASERIQLNGYDYAAAWQTLDQASKIDPDSSAVQEARRRLLIWLGARHSCAGDETFAAIVPKGRSDSDQWHSPRQRHYDGRRT